MSGFTIVGIPSTVASLVQALREAAAEGITYKVIEIDAPWWSLGIVMLSWILILVGLWVLLRRDINIMRNWTGVAVGSFRGWFLCFAVVTVLLHLMAMLYALTDWSLFRPNGWPRIILIFPWGFAAAGVAGGLEDATMLKRMPRLRTVGSSSLLFAGLLYMLALFRFLPLRNPADYTPGVSHVIEGLVALVVNGANFLAILGTLSIGVFLGVAGILFLRVALTMGIGAEKKEAQ